MQQPLKISILKAMRWSIQQSLQTLLYKGRKKLGMWYCTYCDTWHSKRVIEFEVFDGLVDSVCSLGREEYLKHNPELSDEEQFTPADFEAMYAGRPVPEPLDI
jgi:hypothetical protein